MAGSGSLRLKLRDPDGQEREVSFTQDVITIGRSHDCDLPLESGFISRNHARMSYLGSGWQIVDEGSKNGVFVNGQRIAGSTAVKAGDALRIGDYRVAVLDVAAEAPAPVEEGDPDRTLVINPAMLNDVDLSGSPAQAAIGATTPGPTITPPGPAVERAAPEQPPAERIPTAEPAATPPYGNTAGEPSAPPTVAAEPAAAPVPDGEARRQAVPALSEESAAAGAAPVAAGREAPVATTTKAEAGGATGLVVDAVKRSVLLDGRDQTAQLTSREIDLLIALAAAGANGSGVDELANRVWGSGGGDAEMLGRLLYRLRGKLNTEVIEQLPAGGLRLREAV